MEPGSSNNASDLYSGSDKFESRPVHLSEVQRGFPHPNRQNSQTFPLITPRSIPLESFPIHYSFNYPIIRHAIRATGSGVK